LNSSKEQFELPPNYFGVTSGWSSKNISPCKCNQ